MIIADLTHTINEDMPVYPGTEPPKLETANTIEKDGFKETLLKMYSHTGTHMDAPAHIFADRPGLDKLDISAFTGSAAIIDCTYLHAGEKISLEFIKDNKSYIDTCEFVLLCTGWDKYWGCDEYFGKYPVMDEKAAQYIASLGKKGIGVDAISIDPIVSVMLENHRSVLSHGMVIIENLCGLDKLIGKAVQFTAFPLKYANADGAPVRAAAAYDQSEIR